MPTTISERQPAVMFDLPDVGESVDRPLANESSSALRRNGLFSILNDALDWVGTLDGDDQAGMWEEVRQALDSGNPDGVKEIVRGWQTTAAALRDPVSRELLLSDHHDEGDYREVERPA